MEKLANVRLNPLKQSNYVHPITMSYEHNGKQRTWDLLMNHSGVAVILYNTTKHKLVLVKQFRPAVYAAAIAEDDRNGPIDTAKYPASLGVTIECCGGIVDKPISLAEIAAEEMLEECGYKAEASQLEKVAAYKSGVGVSGNTQTLFYCEVTDDMKVSEGGGVDDELIEVVEWSPQEVAKYLKNDVVQSPSNFMFAMQWFLDKIHFTAKHNEVK